MQPYKGYLIEGSALLKLRFIEPMYVLGFYPNVIC
jgi:hypothetical protein